MKTKTEEVVQAVITAEITGDRIETLVCCLRRLHVSFGSDDDLFSCLEEDLLADQPDQIRYEVESRFYESLAMKAARTQPPGARKWINPAWRLEWFVPQGSFAF